jgi:hypothetical protein
VTRARQARRLSLRNVRAGDVFLMPLPEGRFGACRVLQTREGPRAALVATTPWLGSAPPGLGEPRLREILHLTHHAWRNQRCARWVSDPVPASFTRLGTLEPSAKEARLECDSYGGWESDCDQVLRQWRWDHEREAVLAEDARAEEEARRATESARVAYQPLPRATLHEMRRQTHFKQWTGYVEKEYLQEARRIVRAAIDELIELGPDSPAAARLDVFRECVEAFNDSDGGWICTIEREHICDLLDELAALVDLDDYGRDLAAWREW